MPPPGASHALLRKVAGLIDAPSRDVKEDLASRFVEGVAAPDNHDAGDRTDIANCKGPERNE